MPVDEFGQGVLYAASLLVALYDQPGMAATIVREAGLSKADCSTLDDYEKKNLGKLMNEQGIALRGL